MAKSFYHFLMKFRATKPMDPIHRFANEAYRDHSFPKSSTDYHELSNYLELNGHYLDNMMIFDQAWDMYLIDIHKHKNV